jgi:hypothetical protein
MEKQQFVTNEGKFLRQPMKNLPEHVAKGTTDAGYQRL